MDKQRADILHVFVLKELPSVFFRKKMSVSENRPQPLEKRTFFPRHALPRSARENFRFLTRICAGYKQNERGFFSRIRTIEMH